MQYLCLINICYYCYMLKYVFYFDRNNLLQSLPMEISQLSGLREINISFNRYVCMYTFLQLIVCNK